MKYLLVALVAFTIACGAASRSESTVSNEPLRDAKLQNVTAHTTENQPPANSNTAGRWSQSGDPIDTREYDKAIADAERAAKAESADEDVKKALAQAYFDRGFALTQARQYASAIGDYRRALKHDPDHAESKEWIDQIVSIYAMLKKTPQKKARSRSRCRGRSRSLARQTPFASHKLAVLKTHGIYAWRLKFALWQFQQTILEREWLFCMKVRP